MKKKFNVWLLVLLFAFSVGMVEAQKANPPSDFDYDLNEEGSGVVIKNYKGKEKDVIIPSLIEDFPVVQLGKSAFYESNIVSVVIPDSVILIGGYDGRGCFYGCESLQKVTLSKNLKNISEGCFYGCSSLKEITLPEGLETIGYDAFAKSGLESITIPNSVIMIGGYNNYSSDGRGCFYYCESLQKVTLSKNLKYIFGMCFHKCSSLKEIALPEGLEKIGYYAFSESGLESITIPDSVSFIGDFAFQECENLKTVTIGNGVKIIKDCAFIGCSALTTVTIGSGIESIKNRAFANCSSLTTFNIGVEKLYSNKSLYYTDDKGYGYNVFNGCSSLNLKEKKKIRDTGYSDSF